MQYFLMQKVLKDEHQLPVSCPILVLGNKIDRPGATSEDELKTHLGLHGQTSGKVHMCLHVW